MIFYSVRTLCMRRTHEYRASVYTKYLLCGSHIQEDDIRCRFLIFAHSLPVLPLSVECTGQMPRLHEKIPFIGTQPTTLFQPGSPHHIHGAQG